MASFIRSWFKPRSGQSQWNRSMGSLHKFKPIDIDGNELSLESFRGNVMLITNVACKCGYTQKSYDKMTELSAKYGDDLSILCFPSNQFKTQEPWDEATIKEWVFSNWPDLKATLFSKSDVNGDNTNEVYQYLKQCFPGEIAWNFSTKFVIDKNGIPVQRFDIKQSWDDIDACIREEIEKPLETSKL